MEAMGKLLVLFAVMLLITGGALWLFGRAGGGFLPGDIVARRGNTTFVFPIVTSIVVSIVLTVLLNLFLRR